MHLFHGTKTGAHVFQTGPHEIDLIIDDEKTVVVLMGQLNKIDGRVLLIVLFQVCLELLGITAVYCCSDS